MPLHEIEIVCVRNFTPAATPFSATPHIMSAHVGSQRSAKQESPDYSLHFSAPLGQDVL